MNVVLFQPSPLDLIRIAVGMLVLAYVGYCLVKQKVWVRGPVGLKSKTFAWGTREENQTIFKIHVIVGTMIAMWMIIGQMYRLI